LKNSYNQVISFAPNKPMMLAEFASVEAGDGGAKKAAWITDALTVQIPISFPKVKAVVWMNWDINEGKTYPIESSQASKNAWAAGIGSAAYASNQYANLNTSPIPPPSALAALAAPLVSDSPATSVTTAVTTASPTSTVAATVIPASPTVTATAIPASPTATVMATAITASPTPTAADSAILTAMADSYIDSTDPSSVNGTSTSLYVNADPLQTTFLKFDLSPLAGKTLTSVMLKFKTISDESAGSVDTSNVKLVNNLLWKEPYLSYINLVPISPTILGTVPANTIPDTWYTIPLSASDLQNNVGGLFSIAIEATSSDNLILYSRESADQPQLIITYQ
jgi:hypothetical protein